MSIVDGRVLQIRSDLHLDVDGLQVTMSADGRHLVVQTDDAGQLLARAGDVAPGVLGSSLSPTSLPALVRLAGGLLDEAGLSASIVGRRGPLIELGQGCDSRTGRLLLRGDNVRLGPARTLFPVVLAYARSVWLTPARARSAMAGVTTAGVAIAVVLVAGRRRTLTR